MNAVLTSASSSGTGMESLSMTYALMSNESTVYNLTGLVRERHYILIITVQNGSYVTDSTSREVSE